MSPTQFTYTGEYHMNTKLKSDREKEMAALKMKRQ